MVAALPLMVLRAEWNHQPVRSPLRSSSRVTRVVQVGRAVTVAKMVAENATNLGYFVHVLLN
jgi:hypothetical protein